MFGALVAWAPCLAPAVATALSFTATRVRGLASLRGGWTPFWFDDTCRSSACGHSSASREKQRLPWEDALSPLRVGHLCPEGLPAPSLQGTVFSTVSHSKDISFYSDVRLLTDV